MVFLNKNHRHSKLIQTGPVSGTLLANLRDQKIFYCLKLCFVLQVTVSQPNHKGNITRETKKSCF